MPLPSMGYCDKFRRSRSNGMGEYRVYQTNSSGNLFMSIPHMRINGSSDVGATSGISVSGDNSLGVRDILITSLSQIVCYASTIRFIWVPLDCTVPLFFSPVGSNYMPPCKYLVFRNIVIVYTFYDFSFRFMHITCIFLLYPGCD